MRVQSYKDLIVWQKAIEVAVLVYKATDVLPRTELYGLTSQMRRSAVSISSNIAEGRSRGTRKDFRQFLLIALGSSSELESQMILTKQLPIGRNLDFTQANSVLSEVIRMLNSMISKLEADS